MLWHVTTLFPSQWDLGCQRFLNCHGDARAYNVDLHAGRQLFFQIISGSSISANKVENLAAMNKGKITQLPFRTTVSVLGTARFSRRALKECYPSLVLPQPWSPWTPSPAHQGLSAAGWTPANLQGWFWMKVGPLPLCKGSVLRGCCPPPWSSLKTAVGEVPPQNLLRGLVNILNFSELLADPWLFSYKTALRNPDVFLFSYRQDNAPQFLVKSLSCHLVSVKWQNQLVQTLK